jgi:hypothetical protein
MSNIASKLKPMDMELPHTFVVHLVLASLPKEFKTFVVNYNISPETWDLEKLIAMCVQEEERLKASHGDTLNYVRHNKRNNSSDKYTRPQGKPQFKRGSTSSSSSTHPGKGGKKDQPHIEKDQCMWCHKTGHYKKDCPDFLRHLIKKGEDVITFIDETLYVSYSKSTWWIDSGATVHVANSLQSISIRTMLQRGDRWLKVANGVRADVEAVCQLTLELENDFRLQLHNVLYVPSLSRNLISVSCLADDGYNCHFGKEQCEIIFKSQCVGLAIRQDKFYMLPMHETVNSVSNTTSIERTTNDASNKRKRCDNENSVKLWHCRLGHISRGRIERLIKENIPHPLDFSDKEYCIDCVKGKYVKKIKKGAKRSSGVLEIGHTDICGPFPIKSVDGYDSFITFTDDYSRYGYIYPIKERSEALDKQKFLRLK